MIELFLLRRATIVECSPQASSRFCTNAMDCPPHLRACAETEFASKEDMPRSLVSFRALKESGILNQFLIRRDKSTHAIVER